MYSKYEKIDSSIDFTDCFAYGRYKCKALTEFTCKKCGKCNFYMPKYLYEQKVEKLPEKYEE